MSQVKLVEVCTSECIMHYSGRSRKRPVQIPGAGRLESLP